MKELRSSCEDRTAIDETVMIQAKDNADATIQRSKADSMRLLIADDHALVRDALASFLRSSENYDVEIADNYDEAVRKMTTAGHFDVALIDIVMPGMDGISSIEKIVQAFPDTKVVAISGNATTALMHRVIAVGGKGFIPKEISLRSFPTILRMIHAGETFLPYLKNPIIKPARDSEGGLTGGSPYLLPVEIRTLQLASVGWTNKEVAWEFRSTEVLIKMYMRNACSKLGAKNRTHAVMLARQLGLF